MDSSTLHPTNAHVSSEYGAKAITVLEGLEAVRKRPGMYIGSTGQRGLHHLIYEIVDNSVDEALAGQCDHLTVTIHPDQRVSVRDNGRGIPVDTQEQTGRPAAEVVLTVLHAGGKFGEGGGYKVSGGLHGVGVSVVNALSEHLELTVWRDGGMHRQEYERGAPQYDLKRVEDSDDHGTQIRFLPDADIFEELVYDRDVLTQRFREMAFLTRGLRIDFCDERGEPHLESFQYDGGLRDFVTYLHSQGTRSPVHEEVVYFTEATDIGEVEIAMQWNDSYQENLLSFANNINTHEGGSHLAGFRGALTRTLNNYARSEGLLKEKDPNLTGEDMREGLTAIISVKIADPQFEGQTKTKLGNPPVEGLVNSIVGKGFSQFLEENPSTGRLIIDKAMQAARAREAARKARDLTRRKSALESGSLPGKLADCATKDPAKAEIFVVEGDSAGGCTLGSTKVALVDGISKEIQDLAKDWQQGKAHFGYATDENGDIKIVELIEPRLTKAKAALVEVRLDNGEIIKCTPDHPFRLRNGKYIPACELKKGASLMSFKTRLTTDEELKKYQVYKGYELVWQNGQQNWALTHRLADEYNIENNLDSPKNGGVRHHKDFNKRNNNPTNIERMSWYNHVIFHRTHARETALLQWQDPSHRKNISDKAKLQWQDPKYRKTKVREAEAQHRQEGYTKSLTAAFLQWYSDLPSEEKAIYEQRLGAQQEKYWSKEKNRQKQSLRVKQYFENHPEHRTNHSQLAKQQWDDPELLAWRSTTTIAQWENQEYREQHSQAVKNWWQDNPDHRQKLKTAAFNKCLKMLNQALQQDNSQVEQAYEQIRQKESKRSFLYQNFCNKYFDGDETKMLEAAKNYNCKVVSVRHLEERGDVYDLTVEQYHNFALEAGVFIHNSAKQGRTRETQAVLPLRGKIINAEKNRMDKVLSSTEIQAMVTAIGTGIREEFDITKARYHKIVICCDADVDGAHIKTLILTFLFRQMPELIEAGYIYVAKPPLYKVKAGKQELYLDREQELEAFVLRDKLEDFIITDGAGATHQFTAEGWLKFTRVLNQFESWSNKLRSKHGSETVEVLLNTRLIDIGVQSDFLDILGAGVEDELHKLELIEVTDERITLRVQEKLSSLATIYRVPRAMFGEEEFGELARLHVTLQGFIGSGPFHVGLDRHEGKKVTSAPLVRHAVIEMAKEGVSLQRFKGLGEMNPDQLFATTMDPARRTLMRVTIDDATAADLVFSMLMGEEVPPRRQFIEDHARNVDNLDI